MEVVFIKNSNYIEYHSFLLDGYKFNPRRKSINSLVVVNRDIVKYVLNKKISKKIKKVDKTIKLIIDSNVAIIEDCNMMENELVSLIKLIINKYMKYFDEFEFFEYIKKIYILNMALNLKKKLINEVI